MKILLSRGKQRALNNMTMSLTTQQLVNYLPLYADEAPGWYKRQSRESI
jgi:hypothetical protein